MEIPSITNAELSIMELIWKHGSLTARQIREHLYPDNDRSQHGTVQKLLQRLEDKKCVTRDKSMTAHLFSALISRQEYGSVQIQMLASKLTGGSLAPLITHLVEKDKISSEEINRIRTILDNYKSSGE